MQNTITVTPNISLVLIKKPIQSTIFLPSYQGSDFTVTIRDTTGLVSPLHPVTISTTNGAILQDLSNNYLFNKPYGLVRLSLKNNNTWQILHTSGLPAETTAANIQSLSADTAYFNTLSSLTKNVSTMFVNTLQQEVDPINILGNIFLSNLSSPGFSLFKSSFVSYDLINIQAPLFVSSFASFNSSLYVSSISTVRNLAALSTLNVNGSVSVTNGMTTSTLTMNSTVQLATLLVSQSTNTALQVNNAFTSIYLLGLQSPSSISVGESLGLQTLQVSKSLSTTGSLSSIGAIYTIGLSSVLQSTLFVQNVLSNISGFIGNSSLFGDTLTVGSAMNILGSTTTQFFSSSQVYTNNSIYVNQGLSVNGILQVTGTVSTSFLQVGSRMNLGGNLQISSLSSLSSVSARSSILVPGFAVLHSISSGNGVSVSSGMDVRYNAAANALAVNGNMAVGSTINVLNNVNTTGSAYFRGGISDVLNAKIQYSTSVQNHYIVDTVNVGSIRVAPYEVNTPQLEVQNLLSMGQLYVTINQNAINAGSTLINSDTALFSTLVLKDLIASNYTLGVENVKALSFQYLQNTETQPENTSNAFFLNSGSVFTKGLIANTLSTTSLYANNMYGRFTGDATHISNVFFTEQNVQLQNLTTSSIYDFGDFAVNGDAFINKLTTQMFQGQQIVAENLTLGIGYQHFDLTNTKNKIYADVYKAFSSHSIFLNSTIYATADTKVGINTTIPQYSLDVNGILYTSSIFYSSLSLQDFLGISQHTTYATASSLKIKNTLVSPVLQIGNPNPWYIADSSIPLPLGSDSIVATSTSLILEGNLLIQNEQFYPNQTAIIDPTGTYFSNATNDASLMVYANTYTSSLTTSSLVSHLQITTASITFPTFVIASDTDFTYNPKINSMLTLGYSTLSFNSTIFLSQGLGTMAINAPPKPASSNFFTINSNAYFSTATMQLSPSGQIFYSSQLL
jgi:hypothetical protein